MDIFKEITTLKKYLRDKKKNDKKIGLVPTMGALHTGHLALIKAAKSENDIVVSTIFVNPTQFNNPEDLQKYPKTFEEDIEQLRAENCDVVFCPEVSEMYPEGSLLKLDFGHLADEMEGKFRPGHFSGVGLIVSKLFNIVGPDTAYFGQKDLQQFFVIQRMVNDLSYDIELKCHPIVREPSGLAMSSRNMRLTETGFDTAAMIYKSLKGAETSLQQGISFLEIRETIKNALSQADIELEYIEMVDVKTMKLIENHFEYNNVALCIAAFVEGVRLIDNIIITLQN